MDQLERDCLRFLELYPELEITPNITISFKLVVVVGGLYGTGKVKELNLIIFIIFLL